MIIKLPETLYNELWKLEVNTDKGNWPEKSAFADAMRNAETKGRSRTLELFDKAVAYCLDNSGAFHNSIDIWDDLLSYGEAHTNKTQLRRWIKKSEDLIRQIRKGKDSIMSRIMARTTKDIVSRVVARADTWYIRVDYENNAEEWWGNVKAQEPFCDATKSLTHGNVDEVTIPEHEAQAFIDWASQIPGWHDDTAPVHAPEPLVYDQV